MATPTEPVVTVIEPGFVGAPTVTAERTRIASPFGWSAIFAGATVTLGAWLVLHLIGIGIGMTAVDPEDASSLKAVGIGAGAWSLIAPIIALFVGGIVAGRIAPTINAGVAAIHGAVVWGLTMIAALFLVMSLVSTIARGAKSAAGAVGDLAGEAAGAAGDVSMEDLGIGSKDLVAPINQKLREQGKPEVTAKQIEAVAKDVLRSSVRSGRIDQQTVITSVERNTALTGADAQDLARQLQTKLEQARSKVGKAGEQVKETALETVEATGKVLLVLALASLLGLGAAIGGSILSVRHERKEHVVLPRATAGRG